jgi:hypothetical protein
MAALMESGVTPEASRQPRSALAALSRQLRDIAGTFTSRTGRSVTLMLASADPDTELSKAFRHHFILARREEGRRMLTAAVANGELRTELDLDVTLDLLYARSSFGSLSVMRRQMSGSASACSTSWSEAWHLHGVKAVARNVKGEPTRNAGPRSRMRSSRRNGREGRAQGAHQCVRDPTARGSMSIGRFVINGSSSVAR